jgi:hypothetical protein
VTGPWFLALYDAVTAQLEHEFDVLGYEGNTDGVESLERIKEAVAAVTAQRHEAGRADLSSDALGLVLGQRAISQEHPA